MAIVTDFAHFPTFMRFIVYSQKYVCKGFQTNPYLRAQRQPNRPEPTKKTSPCLFYISHFFS